MNSGKSGGLLGIVFCAMFFAVAAHAQTQKADLIGLAKVPGSSSLGWVEVERQNNNVGWQCEHGANYFSLSRLREGRPVIPPEVSGRGSSATIAYVISQGRQPEIDPEIWHGMLGRFIILRLTGYSEGGKRGSPAPPPSFSWRDWLRQTLEKINAKADREGISQGAKKKALRSWVLCHISEVEAERIRQVIYDNNLQSGGKK
ncbi:MAG: hypothetical protein OXI90_17485 [Gammaproteobacteria bacterium]|nr:hypothetical protein [Gammaproteobacteria bacterium]MDE2894629.1 hypothetical protein [Chloroflexota bacterium]